MKSKERPGDLLRTPRQQQSKGNSQFQQEKAAQFQISSGTPYQTAYDGQQKNKRRRQYSEISKPDLYQRYTPLAAFDQDNSTLKPNQNTVVRNPTMNSMGIGKDRSRGQPQMKPVNLTQQAFDNQDLDSQDEYYSLNDFNQRNSLNCPVLEDIDEKDSQKATMSVSAILAELAHVEADPYVQDIANTNSKGNSYEYSPFQFMPSNQFKIPPQILRDINQQKKLENFYFDCGYLNPLKIVYFCVCKNVYLWSYDNQQIVHDSRQSRTNNQGSIFMQTFDQKVTTLAITNPLRFMKGYKQDDKFLLVATVEQIKAFHVKYGDKDGKIILCDINLSIAVDNNLISKMIQLNKNGRIFFGGNDGHVNELSLEDNSLSLLSFFTTEKKRLKKNDLQERSLLSKLVPTFLKLEDKKHIIDLKIDDQRNILYSLSTSLDSSTKGQSIIEVFDFGILANHFRKIVSIRQYEIVRAMYQYQRNEESLRGKNLLEIAIDFKIIFISPIQFSESKQWHLLVITQNGFRIYIQFKLNEAVEPTQDEIENAGNLGELLILERITNEWQVAEILKFPNEEAAIDPNFTNSIMNGLFRVHTLNAFYDGLNLSQHVLSYNNQNSLLIYGQNKQDEYSQNVEDFNPDEPNSGLRINFIKKNESSFTHLKQIHMNKLNPQHFSLAEQFSVVSIFVESPKPQPVVSKRLHSLTSEYEQTENEIVLEISNGAPQASKEILNLLGLTNSHLEKKQSGSTCFYEYMALSDFEKQVYLSPNKIGILTDQRIIETLQMRPIDYLVNILQAMARAGFENLTHDDFEDFIDQFSIREVCAMLIQILSEATSLFIYSKRIDNTLYNNKQRKRMPLSQPRQMIRKDYNFGTTSRGSLYPATSPHRPLNISNYKMKPSNISSQYQGANTANQSIFYQAEQVGHEYIYRPSTQEIRQLALELLIIYGDTMPISTNVPFQFEMMENPPLSSLQFSHKHQGLYLYVQRVLRPIWEVKIAYLPDPLMKHMLPTFDSLAVVKSKLKSLYDMINAQHLHLFGENKSTSQDVQVIENHALLCQFILLRDLPFEFKDRLEVFEKHSLINLKYFVQRCLEVIEILDILTFDGEVDLFVKMQRLLTREQLKLLNQLKFQDLATQQFNIFIKKILEASIQIKSGKDDFDTTDRIKKRANRINRLCKSLFTQQETNIFVGESLIQTAIIEQNVIRKEDLLKQGIEQLIQEPLKIDLGSVVPLLLESGNYSSIVDMCLRKARAIKSIDPLQKSLDPDELQDMLSECYEVVLSLFGAIDSSITKDRNIYIGNLKTRDILDLFIKKVNQIPKVDQRVILRNRIIKRIEEYKDSLLMNTLFNYLLSKPRDQVTIDSLPKLGKEMFETVCDTYLQQGTMKRGEFDTLVKLMIKHQEAERLARLVINVVTDRFQLQEEDAENHLKQSFIETDHRLTFLQAASSLLLECRAQLGQEDFVKLQKELNECDQAVQHQLSVLKSMQKKEGIFQKFINDKEHNSKEDRNQVKLQLQALKEGEQRLEQKLFSLQELFEQFVEKYKLYEAKINILVGQAQNSREQQQKIINTKIKDTFQGLMEYLLQFYKDSWQQEVCELLTETFGNGGNKENLKQMLAIVDKLNDKFFLDKDLYQDLKRLSDGFKLQDTMFWIQEFCFKQETLELKPSEIFFLFSPFRQANQQRIDEIVIAKMLSCLILWTKVNGTLFRGGDTIPFSQQQLIIGSLGRKEEFVKDLRGTASKIWFQSIQRDIKEFLEKNKLILPKKIADQLSELFKRAKNEFEAMCIQHEVPLVAQSVGFAQQERQSQISRFQAPDISQSPFQSKVSVIPKEIGDASFTKKSPTLLDNQIRRSQSGIRINPKPAIDRSREEQKSSKVDKAEEKQLSENRSRSLTAMRNNKNS